MTVTESRPELTFESVRAALAQRWHARDPHTPGEIAAFYRDCPGELIADDLELFHQQPTRQRWQHILVELAKNPDVHLVVDIGSGAGHDLRALRDADVGAELLGVEPNRDLRARCKMDGFAMLGDVADAPLEDAQLINCIDTLEHIHDPETWLGAIAARPKVGAILLETSAVWDVTTPLHLPANRGWAPGRVLQQRGWDRIATHDRMSAWQRFEAPGPIMQTFIVVFAGGGLSAQTHKSVLALLRSDEGGAYNWVPSEATEAGLLRARSGWVSKWYRDTCSDVVLMVDADMGFSPRDAMHIVDLAREKRSIVVGAYPTKDGKNLTVRPLEDDGELTFGPDEPPRAIRWGATGFMAIHRDVIDAMVAVLPLCGAETPHSMWPFFNLDFAHDPLPDGSDGWQLMGEDFSVCQRALDLGFTVWLDTAIEVIHWSGLIPVTIRNMKTVRELIGEPS